MATEPRTRGVDEKFCATCGEIINIRAEICPKCGVRQKQGINQISKVALILITFFLGGFGGHKFYTQKYVQGIFYILFCWTGIPGLIAFVEFIIYLFTSEEDLQGKYSAGSAGIVIVAIAGFFGFIAMVGILAAIAIPNFIAYRNKAYCGAVESDAGNVMNALASHLTKPGNEHIPTLDELREKEGLVTSNQNIQIIGSPGSRICIAVTDDQENCPHGGRYVYCMDEDYGEWQP